MISLTYLQINRARFRRAVQKGENDILSLSLSAGSSSSCRRSPPGPSLRSGAQERSGPDQGQLIIAQSPKTPPTLLPVSGCGPFDTGRVKSSVEWGVGVEYIAGFLTIINAIQRSVF